MHTSYLSAINFHDQGPSTTAACAKVSHVTINRNLPRALHRSQQKRVSFVALRSDYKTKHQINNNKPKLKTDLVFGMPCSTYKTFLIVSLLEKSQLILFLQCQMAVYPCLRLVCSFRETTWDQNFVLFCFSSFLDFNFLLEFNVHLTSNITTHFWFT